MAAFGRSFGFTVGEVASRHALEFGGGGDVNGRGRPLGRSLHEWPDERDEDSLDAAWIFGAKGGTDQAGMQSVRGDGGASQPSGEFVSEQDVASFDWLYARAPE
jgi:hypothetical protein